MCTITCVCKCSRTQTNEDTLNLMQYLCSFVWHTMLSSGLFFYFLVSQGSTNHWKKRHKIPTLLAFKEIQEGECEKRGFSIVRGGFIQWVHCVVSWKLLRKSPPALISSFILFFLLRPRAISRLLPLFCSALRSHDFFRFPCHLHHTTCACTGLASIL